MSCKGQPLDRGTRRRVVTFLQEGDLVKFADIVPSEADAYEMITQGRMIVEATKPVVIRADDVDGGSPTASGRRARFLQQRSEGRRPISEFGRNNEVGA